MYDKIFHQLFLVKKLSKDKKRETVLNDFIIIVSESNRQPNKLWVDQGREFYNSPFTTLVGTKLLKIFQWMKKLNSLLKLFKTFPKITFQIKKLKVTIGNLHGRQTT